MVDGTVRHLNQGCAQGHGRRYPNDDGPNPAGHRSSHGQPCKRRGVNCVRTCLNPDRLGESSDYTLFYPKTVSSFFLHNHGTIS